MKKTIFILVATLFVLSSLAVAGNIGLCVKDCVQYFNPGLNDTDPQFISDFNAVECVLACKEGMKDGICTYLEDDCCNEYFVDSDPDCVVEPEPLPEGSPCEPGVDVCVEGTICKDSGSLPVIYRCLALGLPTGLPPGSACTQDANCASGVCIQGPFYGICE